MEVVHISLNNLINNDIEKLNEFLKANRNKIIINLEFLLLVQKFNIESINIIKNVLSKSQNSQEINDFYYILLSFHSPEQIDNVFDYFLDFVKYFNIKEFFLLFKVYKNSEDFILKHFFFILKRKIQSIIQNEFTFDILQLMEKWLILINVINLDFLRKELQFNEIFSFFFELPLKLNTGENSPQLDNYLRLLIKFLCKYDEKQAIYKMINYILNQPQVYPSCLFILDYLAKKKNIKIDYFPEKVVHNLLILDCYNKKLFVHLFKGLSFKYEYNLRIFNDFKIFESVLHKDFNFMISIIRKHPNYFYSIHSARILEEIHNSLVNCNWLDYELFLKVYSEFRYPETEEYIYQIGLNIINSSHFIVFTRILAHLASDGAISILVGYLLNPDYDQYKNYIDDALNIIKKKIKSNGDFG